MSDYKQLLCELFVIYRITKVKVYELSAEDRRLMLISLHIIPKSLRTRVVCECFCAGCNATMSLSANRHLSKLIWEHQFPLITTCSFHHVKSSENSRALYSQHCFSSWPPPSGPSSLKSGSASHSHSYLSQSFTQSVKITVIVTPEKFLCYRFN